MLRGQKILIGAILFLMVALISASFTGGWILSNQWSARQTSPEVTPSVVMVPQIPDGVRMPDLRGLPKEDALQVIADAGWDVSTVTTTTEPFAGPVDMVVAQNPPFGTTNVTEITLTLSGRALIPDYANRSATEIVTQLRNLGVNVQTQYAYDPNVPAGQVVSIFPDTGEPLPTDATVTIAEAGTALFLSQIQCPVGCLSSKSDLTLNGTPYTNGLTGQVSFNTRNPDNDVQHHEFVLGRHANQLLASVGIPDNVSDKSGTIRVVVVGDDVQIGEVSVGYGATAELDVPVTGVLRLDIQTMFDVRPDGTSGNQTVAFGNARVVGSDAEIAEVGRR